LATQSLFVNYPGAVRTMEDLRIQINKELLQFKDVESQYVRDKETNHLLYGVRSLGQNNLYAVYGGGNVNPMQL
jgi:hypothetical protein